MPWYDTVFVGTAVVDLAIWERYRGRGWSCWLAATSPGW